MNNQMFLLQEKLKPIVKDSKNPHFGNTYYDINSLLAVLKPILSELELTLSQPIEVHDGKMVLHTMIKAEAVLIAECAMTLPDQPDPQKLGSCISYYRRYSLTSLLAIESEDDDGNIAAGNTEPKKEYKDKVGFNETMHTKIQMPSIEKEAFKETARKFEKLGGGYEQGFFLPHDLAQEYINKQRSQ